MTTTQPARFALTGTSTASEATAASISGPLRETLLQTRGSNANDTECPICFDPFESDTSTLEHTECHRRFHGECLRNWIYSLSRFPKCPMCRGPLGEEDVWEMTPSDRARAVITARRRLDPPAQFTIGPSTERLKTLIRLQNPFMDDDEIEELVIAEENLSLDALETLGQRHWETIDAEDLIRRAEEFGLDDRDKWELWNWTRLFGIAQFFLHQVRSVPELGVWTCVPPRVEVVQDEAALSQYLKPEALNSQMRRGSSNLIQVPIPTSYIDHYLTWIRRGPFPYRFDDLDLQEMANENDTAHWAILDFRDLDACFPDLIVIPWPKDRVLEGFDSLTFPRWEEGDGCVTGGWHAMIDAECLEVMVSRWRGCFVRHLLADESRTEFEELTKQFQNVGIRVVD